MEQNHRAREVARLKILHGGFPLFQGAAADIDVVGCASEEVDGHFEANATICCWISASAVACIITECSRGVLQPVMRMMFLSESILVRYKLLFALDVLTDFSVSVRCLTILLLKSA